MKSHFSKTVLLAFILLLFVAGCKSHKNVATVTNPVSEKPKPEEPKVKAKAADEGVKSSITGEETDKGKLDQYFTAIANAPDVTTANNNIAEALNMFNSPQAPVLIVVSEENGSKDYDRPTSIQAYLNYVKDQKKNSNKIEYVKRDQAGKITEIELRKTN